MKLTKTILIIFFEIIQLFIIIRSDHVQIIRCSEDQKCLENLDEKLMEVIRENLFNSTQPCEHFWDYACGSWTSAPYYDHVDNFGALSNFYADNLIKVLQKLYNRRQDTQELVDQIWKYFLSCKSVESYYLNMAPYLKELPVHEIFGESFQWSVLFREKEGFWQNFKWLKAVAYLRKFGFREIFLQESVGFARNNSLQYVIELKTSRAKTNFENKYKVLQVMEEFGLIMALNNSINYLKLAQELYELDNKLFNLYKRCEQLKQHHFITLGDLHYLFPKIDWTLYFELLLNQVPAPQTPIEYSGNLEYFRDLEIILKQTPNHIQGSYILIRFCQYLMDIRPLISERECLLHTNVMFPVGVNYVYNRFLYKTRLKDEEVLITIFSHLKQEFYKILLENKFSLTAPELQYLQDKLNLMQIKIGNLPLILDDINHYYASVQLDRNNFYHNHLEMLKFRTLQQHQVLLSPLLQPVNLEFYYVNDDISQLRNAPYFIHKRNIIIVPMLFLQLPFYHYAQHPVFQYSLVGWILAHELSHAFDIHGLYFDAWGNENLLGPQISCKTLYLTSVDCLTERSPSLSLNERVADVNGLQLAWQTFFHQFIENGELFGNFSLPKLFFLSFAQFFCGSLPHPIGHDPDDVRVRQSVANIREFAQIFHCSKNAKENPAKKCNIWRN